LLDCITNLRSGGVTGVVIVHVVHAGYGQEPGPRALADLQDWLAGRASVVRADDLRVDVPLRAARTLGDKMLATVSAVKAPLQVIGSRSHDVGKRRETHAPSRPCGRAESGHAH
jgi:hypothetical protein